ncbi:CAP-Gly domain-containing linker protein 1 isoform X1 [Drosophila subobscura]|uniref:CAP-Gly domain-containing linker protein 1 isoform X1 n=1 Tax=Drosophila subobscura TaxID=7241 RepID=UPI00155A1F0D|nr:CAP-Gly domain-containing linker protein 1 isoform X1 [Drosophila subobscura]XP_034664348.1 CAP-Gly domain-containing linker protein 1 isoform X1 [Drosophila subobscura]
MNTPGMSLFQGAEPLNVSSTLERQEEEEALEDQKRRDEELGNLLENAFDDLDDDESTIDSTTNFQSDLLPEQPHHHHHHQQQQQQQHHPAQGYVQPTAEEDHHHRHASEMHKLKMMLESKSHECEHIGQQATDALKKLDEEQKRVRILQAELDRALREKQNTHELLVDTKAKCSNQESSMEKLREEKKRLEEDNTRLEGQLELTRAIVSDLKSKYDMVERDSHKRDDRIADSRIRQLEEHHRAQCDLLQEQLSQGTDQLNKKQNELEKMTARYNALQSNLEATLREKAATINELNAALDVAQSRCQQLDGKPNYEPEYSRQQHYIRELEAKIDAMEQTIALLNGHLSGATAELDLMDTLLQQNQTDEPSAGPRAASTRLVGSTPLNPVDRIGHIKQELYRALANLKHMREEVRKLEKQLEERNQELRLLRGQENQSLVQLATLKEDKVRLESRVKNLQQELEELDRRSKNDCKLQEEVNVLMAERDAVTEHRQKMDNQLKKVQIDLDRVNQDHEKLKQNYEQLLQDNRQLRSRDTADNMRLDLERHKILLKDAQSEVERLKKLYADIANDKETLSYELRKLRELDTVKELHEQRQQLANLQRTVQIAELKSEELASILEAEKHSHQRELQAMRDKCEHDKCEEVAAAAAKENSANCSKCVEKWSEITKAEIQMLKLQNINARQAKDLRQLAEELEQSKAFQAELEEKIERSSQQESLLSELKDKAKQMEEYIRQQEEATAKKTPSPRAPSIELSPERIKRIEQRVRDEMAKLFAVELKNFNARLHQSEEKNRCLQREHQLVCGELQQRQNEVDLLKQTILAEREKIEEILEAKEEKQKVMLQKCRSEIQAKNQRIAELMRALDEQHASIDSERKSMKAVMAQWDAQKQSVEQHWREQLQMLRETHEEALRTTQQRYQSAKRTAHNYKLYAEDKEAHMKREYDRIKHEYELSLAKIELQMNQRLERKSRDKENQPSNSNSNSNNR